MIIYLLVYLFSPHNSLTQITIVPQILTEVHFWFQFENYRHSFNPLVYSRLKLLQTVASLLITRAQTRKPFPVSCRHLFLPLCTNKKGEVNELRKITVRFTSGVKSAVNGLISWNLFSGKFYYFKRGCAHYDQQRIYAAWRPGPVITMAVPNRNHDLKKKITIIYCISFYLMSIP
jgi:hypothetical protein